MKKLFSTENHMCFMFSDLTSAEMIQANQHIIFHNNEAVILDPGGHKVYTKLFSEISKEIPGAKISHIFLSHQDPDIIASLNGWLLTTDAKAYLPEIWIRFITHFGIDQILVKKVTTIPDSGGIIKFGDIELKIIPAHFLHSSGNMHLYDPVSKILYTGDLGLSIGAEYEFVEDFDNHIKYMENFHKRYIPASKAITIWLKTLEKLNLEIETIAPQHGAIINGKENVNKFFNWIKDLKVGVDISGDSWI
ncbi:MAG: MBL fold metallo-hydrolase [Candidatus Aminicenantes bacterium]|nr:MBL fold metallo-hydrolase [Candidatus Aminicenantes bacterium]